MEEKANGKRRGISIFGDSISTYEGYLPYGYSVYYDAWAIARNGLRGVEDTWWMQVIGALGGELCRNNSFSGSTVAGGYFPAGCSDERCHALHGTDMPDVILIYLGTNDRGYGVPHGGANSGGDTFCGAYRAMLQKLKRAYPAAEIVAATLPRGNLRGVPSAPACSDGYDAAIRVAAEAEGCRVADIAAYGERYETLDGLHPTREGHRQLFLLWMRALEAIGFYSGRA